MKTKSILIILAIIAAAGAVFFLTKKPATDMTLDLSQPESQMMQNENESGMQSQQNVIVEPAPAVTEETAVTPEFPTTGVKPE